MAGMQVALHLTGRGPRCEAALSDLREELGEGSVPPPDDVGMLAVAVPAGSHDEAVGRVRDAIARIGADECFEFGEPSGYVPHEE